jgi:hypothetical protein
MIRLAVTPADGDPLEVTVPGRVLLDWERTHKKALGKAIADGRSEWAYELAHATLTKRHGEERTFDAWLDSIDDVRLQPEEIEATLLGLTLGMPAEAVEHLAERLLDVAKLKRGLGATAELLEDGDEDGDEVPSGGETDPSPAGSPAS